MMVWIKYAGRHDLAKPKKPFKLLAFEGQRTSSLQNLEYETKTSDQLADLINLGYEASL